MPVYTPTTWVNGVTAANAAHMNNIENQLSAVQYGLNIITPYQFENNITINSGVTKTYTCTGVGGVPSGAKAVLMNLWFLGSAVGTYAVIPPHGTAENVGNYPAVGACANTGAYTLGSFIAVLDGSGKIDVSAVSGNLTGFYLWMYGYLY